MDPTLAPDFVPPSKQSQSEREIRSSTTIPNFSPIQSAALQDLSDLHSELDTPSPPPPPHIIREPEPHHGTFNKMDENVEQVPENIPRIASSMSASPPTDNESSPPTRQQQQDNGRASALTSPYIYEPSGVRPVVQSADLEEVPTGVVRQAKKLEDYSFPVHRLGNVMMDESKSPLVLVACGSFSPITYLHLRMFEMAIDQIREHTRFEVIGGYYSPVSDNYKKPGLAPADHRVRMCELACERTSSWLMVDAWESLQPTYTRTALVLDHFNKEINELRGGIATKSGKRKGVKIMLLAGGDLIESMGEPNVWAEEDLHHILGRYGCIIVERTGSDVRSFLLSHDVMYEHRRNVLVIKQLIYNDISSTKVRLFIRRGMSVQYLLPNSVIRYIIDKGLYLESEPVKQVLGEKGD